MSNDDLEIKINSRGNNPGNIIKISQGDYKYEITTYNNGGIPTLGEEYKDLEATAIFENNPKKINLNLDFKNLDFILTLLIDTKGDIEDIKYYKK